MSGAANSEVAPHQESMLLRHWRSWTVISRSILNYQARFLLDLVYFVLVVPISLLARLAPAGRLGVGWQGDSFWVVRRAWGADLKDAKRQF